MAKMDCGAAEKLQRDILHALASRQFIGSVRVGDSYVQKRLTKAGTSSQASDYMVR